MAKHHSARDYPFISPGYLFATALEAVMELGYAIRHADRDMRVLSVNTGGSIWTWRGQDMTIRAIELEGGGSRLEVSAHNAAFALTSWGEGSRVAYRLFDAVEQAFAPRQ